MLDLSRRIRIALTSTLARTLDEVLRTSLYVEVKWGDHTLFRQTFPVSMAPVDQWADTNADRNNLQRSGICTICLLRHPVSKPDDSSAFSSANA